ncbi:MAG: 1-acyl-sn-glycerol-3-phosphate acyltransferase [Phycisphaerae bacterium]|nr:1-acyl-sn-glycerol-3-phosphate acyltransferase [Gemmatimonadaceae bacterium]
MLYELLKPVAGIALRWYYRSVSVAGRQRIPESGPVFLAVNHPNAMVDALVVAWTTRRRVGFTAKSTIFANPLLSAFLRSVGAIPLKRVSDMAKASDAITPVLDPSRNADSFRAVSLALAAGRAIVVFPEGKSHSEPQLAPLRTGLARMALQARDTMGVRGIQIVPIGLLFEMKEQPRSEVLVQVGAPILVDSIESNEHAVESLTALVAERLEAVTLNFESAEDAARIAAVGDTLAALLEPVSSLGEGGPSLSSRLAMTRRAERVRKALEHVPSVELTEVVAEFERRLELFRTRLAAERIAASDLFIDVSATPGARFAIREALLAAVLIPVSWWGRLTHWLPIRITRWLALRSARNRDDPAMYTIVIGLVLVVAAYAVQTVIVGVLFGFWWSMPFLLSLVPSASSEMRYGDRARRRTERMRAYLRFRQEPQLRAELLAEADWLRKEAGVIEQRLSFVA